MTPFFWPSEGWHVITAQGHDEAAIQVVGTTQDAAPIAATTLKEADFETRPKALFFEGVFLSPVDILQRNESTGERCVAVRRSAR